MAGGGREGTLLLFVLIRFIVLISQRPRFNFTEAQVFSNAIFDQGTTSIFQASVPCSGSDLKWTCMPAHPPAVLRETMLECSDDHLSESLPSNLLNPEIKPKW